MILGHATFLRKLVGFFVISKVYASKMTGLNEGTGSGAFLLLKKLRANSVGNRGCCWFCTQQHMTCACRGVTYCPCAHRLCGMAVFHLQSTAHAYLWCVILAIQHQLFLQYRALIITMTFPRRLLILVAPMVSGIMRFHAAILPMGGAGARGSEWR